MATYKLNGISVEAEQFKIASKTLPTGAVSRVFSENEPVEYGNRTWKMYYIDTIEGRRNLSDGCWVITFPNNKKIVISNVVFELLCERNSK